MSYGKTIEMFLVNGSSDGIVTAELSNWNGKAIKIPRIMVKDSTRDDIKLPGVYFLFCDNSSVYIGEAENVKDRLCIHINDYNSNKEDYYWATAVCFVCKDLNKALIRYLENSLFEISKRSGTYSILTKSTYKNTVLKESQIASMEEFLDNIKILIKTLGYNVLDENQEQINDDELFYCKGNGADAIGFLSLNGFKVKKDSLISNNIAPSLKTHVVSWYNLRKMLEVDKIIDDRKFVIDYEFSSPSAASSIILGRPSNGRVDWKNLHNDKSLKDI